MPYKIKKQNNIYLILITLACILSVVTQMPSFIGNSLIKNISLLLWIVLFIVLISNTRITLNITMMKIICLYMVFIIVIGVLEILSGKSYFQSIGVYPLNVSLFIFINGYLVSSKINYKEFRKVILWYSSIATIVVFNVYLQIKDALDWSGNFGYSYSEKNSISTIALTVIVSLLIYKKDMKKIYKIIVNIVILFLFFCMLVLKSRATFVSAIMALIIYILFNKKGYKSSLKILSISLLILLLIITNENLYSLIIEKIIFNKMDYTKGYNIYMMTSGRSEHLMIFLEQFKLNPIVGVGPFWLESFPLCMLMQFGIVGFIPIAIIAISPLLWSFKIFIFRKKLFGELETITMLYSAIFITNGVFEASAPLGPGVKCFILWLTFGFSLGYMNNKEKINNNYERRRLDRVK